MNLDVTHGAIFVGLQVAHNAGFADLGCGEREDNQNTFLPRPVFIFDLPFPPGPRSSGLLPDPTWQCADTSGLLRLVYP